MNTQNNIQYALPVNNEAQSFEYYRFNFSKEEVAQVYKQSKKSYTLRIIFLSVFYLIMLVFAILMESMVSIGLILGVCILAAIIYSKNLKIYKRNMNESLQRIPLCIYEYKFFSDSLCFNIIKDSEIVRTQKVLFTEIEHVLDTGDFLQIIIHGQWFLLRKAQLPQTSVIYQFLSYNPKKFKKSSSMDTLNQLASILFVLTLVSLTFGFYFVSETSSSFEFFPNTTWIFFLFTPIPIASIVLGFVLKAKRQKYLKHIIAGFIVLALMCVFGSSYYIFSAVYPNVAENITEETSSLSFVEYELQLDIPQYDTIVTQDWTTASQSSTQRYIYFTTDLTFEEDITADFENEISNDSRWITSISKEMSNIVPNLYDETSHEYLMIYNYDLEEFNTLPENNGTYYFIALFFSPENNTLKIVEYDAEYIKDGTSFIA